MEYTTEQIKNAWLKALEDFIEKIKNDEIVIENILSGASGIKDEFCQEKRKYIKTPSGYFMCIYFYKNIKE